jgi:CRP/FNR family transcriptional regulator, cyclic AMP receptor protein
MPQRIETRSAKPRSSKLAARSSKVETETAPEVFGFLTSGSVSKRHVEFRKRQILFSQGEPVNNIFYIQTGSIKLAATSTAGKEAVVAILGPGDFLGEACLAGQPVWIATATAMTQGSALVDQFISYMVTRNIRTEEDLIDQLFNSSEKRLARTLLLLARFGKPNQALTLPRVSQTVLAEMVGTTRTRVNFFMNKFRKLGFIEYNGTLKINNSLLSVVLRD